MSPRATTSAVADAGPVPLAHSAVLQRQCACGAHTSAGAACAACASDGQPRPARLARALTSGSDAGEVPSIVHEVLRAPGRPLDGPTRAFMEPRFHHDFSQVRVHDDARAAASAQAVHALAYTVGRDVVFGAGRYAPDRPAGRRLIAHELTHTLQQHGPPSSAIDALTVSDPSDAGERDAERAADAVLGGRSAPPPRRGGPRVQRQTPGETPAATEAESGPGPYDGCGSYAEPVQRARAEATRLAERASSALDDEHVAQVAPLLAAHFHLDPGRPESAADLQLIRDQFARMRQALSSGIRIFCRSAPSPGLGAPRPSMPVDEGCRSEIAHSTSCAGGDPTATVEVCELGLLEMGDPLPKTLLHEFAHVACNGTPQVRSGGRAGGEVYYDGDRLPGDETNVLVHADSYAWFAMQADQVLPAAEAAAGREGSGSSRTGWGVLTGVGGALAVAGGIGLGYGLSNQSDAAIGLGIAGLAVGGIGLGLGIAGLLGAFDRRARSPQAGAPAAATRAAPPTLSELAAMSAWQLAQLPETAFAAEARGATDDAGPRHADYARAGRLVRCIAEFHHLTVDPETAGQVGRDPTGTEWPVLRQTLSQILGHADVGALVQGPGGRSDLGTPPLANRIRIVSRVEWGIKRFQLENLVSPIGGGADPLVRRWWAEPRCAIQPGASPRIVGQEQRMAVFHEKVMESGLGSGGFYFPPDDTIYIAEPTAAALAGTGAESADARLIAGHEMVHLVGGRERTRQAFVDYFQDEHWICYWSAFEEGMAELTARDALAPGQSGSDRGYESFVQLMREIMQALGEARVRRAYFTGTPDREIFEQVRLGLPTHMDPTLPPVCRTL